MTQYFPSSFVFHSFGGILIATNTTRTRKRPTNKLGRQRDEHKHVRVSVLDFNYGFVGEGMEMDDEQVSFVSVRR